MVLSDPRIASGLNKTLVTTLTSAYQLAVAHVAINDNVLFSSYLSGLAGPNISAAIASYVELHGVTTNVTSTDIINYLTVSADAISTLACLHRTQNLSLLTDKKGVDIGAAYYSIPTNGLDSNTVDGLDRDWETCQCTYSICAHS